MNGMAPDLHMWQPWTPDEIAERLSGLEVPWYVAAGWAIDLFLGSESREHEDLEIGVPAARFNVVAPYFAEYDLMVPIDGLFWPYSADKDSHQTWIRERAGGAWKLDVFREPSQEGHWVCRRDESIKLRYDVLIEHTASGIPYARPEIVLLFKAKAARDKDSVDLAAVLPRLTSSRRELLHDWIVQVHGNHPWLAQITSTAASLS